MYALLGCVTYTRVSSWLLGIYLFENGWASPCISESMPSPTRRWCFLLFRCQFSWKPWCFCITSLEKDLWMPPRNLFVSHFLVFTSFLIWYNHCLPGPLQLEDLCPWDHSSQQQRLIHISANFKHLRKLTWGDISRGQLRRHGQDPERAALLLEGKLRFPVPNVLSQGQSRHHHHEFAYNHSYLLSTCLCWSLSWLSENTMPNHTLRVGIFQKVAGLTNMP